jgi:superfamily II DNA or RNA helicase
MFDKLFNYQKKHVLQLIHHLESKNIIVDSSDTGCGKTYTTIQICKKLNLVPFVICPKSVISNWIDVCNYFDCRLFGISNYELCKNSKYYDKNKIVENKYITKENKSFTFSFPSNVIIIFDEAHKCKNNNTINTKMLQGAKESCNKIILLTATLSDRIENLKFFGLILGMYSNIRSYNGFMKNKRYEFRRSIKMNKIGREFEELYVFRELLFNGYSSRMSIKELEIPPNQIMTNSYSLKECKKIDELYKEINTAVSNLHIKEERKNSFAVIIRARQKIELLKIPIFIELIEEGLENGLHVVVFVNFLETQNILANHLKCTCLLKGGQTIQERDNNIKDFQSNKSKIIISIIQVGSLGISLNDTKGDNPRMSIISPTWSGQDFVQILGRIYRAGTKSHVIQKIVLVANTIETSVGKVMNTKFKNINAINKGEFGNTSNEFNMTDLIK